MKILNSVLATVLLMASTVGQAQEQATASVPKEFPSVGADREAILALLDNYTMAVSTKESRSSTFAMSRRLFMPRTLGHAAIRAASVWRPSRPVLG